MRACPHRADAARTGSGVLRGGNVLAADRRDFPQCPGAVGEFRGSRVTRVPAASVPPQLALTQADIMETKEIHAILLERFGESAVGAAPGESIDPWIEVSPQALVDVAGFLRDDERLQFDHLNDLCGVDYLEPDPKKAARVDYEPHAEVVYNLSSTTLKHRTRMKVILPRWKNDEPGNLPEVPSVASVWGIADWHEREAYDLVGIRFTEHPNLRRILCPEDWVGHALRRDYEFPLEYHGVRGR